MQKQSIFLCFYTVTFKVCHQSTDRDKHMDCKNSFWYAHWPMHCFCNFSGLLLPSGLQSQDYWLEKFFVFSWELSIGRWHSIQSYSSPFVHYNFKDRAGKLHFCLMLRARSIQKIHRYIIIHFQLLSLCFFFFLPWQNGKIQYSTWITRL